MSDDSSRMEGALAQALSDVGCMLIVLLAVMRGFVSKFLSTKPMRYLGKLSYSFYLTHVLVVGSIGPVLLHVGISPLAVALIIIAISFLVAWLF